MAEHVHIIGAGWAGLAAAIELCESGKQVTVYESAPQTGGRARAIAPGLDNGQHLLIGAYQQTLGLLDKLGLQEDRLLLRYPQQLRLMDLHSRQTAFDLKLPKTIAPLHLLWGMLASPSLTLREKLISLYRFDRLLKQPLSKDLSVSRWLQQARLPDKLVTQMLEPLCLAAMTTQPHQASARGFQSVLKKTFSGSSRHTDLLIPRVDLSQLFPAGASDYIQAHGGKVISSARCRGLVHQNGRIRKLQINDELIDCQQVILATPPWISRQLLQTVSPCQPVAEQLEQLRHEPVVTVYLQYPRSTRLDLPMIGLLNGIGQWLFDRQVCGQDGLMAVVISAGGEHLQWDNEQLLDAVEKELAHLYPHWPRADHGQVIREKRATLQCHVDVDNLRPSVDTPVKNLYLCGDYVRYENKNTPSLPSTLEAAVESGVKCAQLLIRENT